MHANTEVDLMRGSFKSPARVAKVTKADKGHGFYF